MKRIGNRITFALERGVIKAHEATGHTTMNEHVAKMHTAVNKAIQGDERFHHDKAASYERPYCVDITTPDEDGTHHAIIRHSKGHLVRHGFDYDKEEGKATMHEGESTPTERTSIYAREIERHENMVKASEDMLCCRDTGGVKLSASEPWKAGKSVSFIYVPGGVTTISAGFRRNESITCTVVVDKDTASDLQESFDFIAATEKQEPYADEDHESKKATLRFPANKVSFTYGTHKGEEGVIVSGGEPTSYGAEAVNGKVYASWSPEFATDADYSKAKCKKGHWTFPDGVRGSASNPARLVAVNFVTGALTNKPAFKNMPPVKAKHMDADGDEIIEAHWHIVKRGAKYHVIKEDGTDEGASDSEAMAKKHLAALYANSPEAKEEKKTKATAADPVMDAIYARHEREVAEAEALANKSPDVQARMREDSKTLDQTVESIIARNRERDSFEDILLARNPELKNRETIDALAARKN